MATFTLDLNVPIENVEEFIEALRGIGAVESLQFSIEADTRLAAVRETIEVLEDFSATYRGVPLNTENRYAIEDSFKRTSPRASHSL